jgi:osmotically-inducible protein OsmY
MQVIWKRAGGCGLLLLTLLAGCNPEDKQRLTDDTKRLAASTQEALTNANLAGRVNFVLSVWKGIEKSGFNVEAKEGVITLSGEVKSSAMKQKVLAVTRQIEGVEKVVDKLTVQAP